MVNDSHHFCDICFRQFLANVIKPNDEQGVRARGARSGSSAGGDVPASKRVAMSTLTKYSLSTYTSALRNHLEETHNIVLMSVKSSKQAITTISTSVKDSNLQKVQNFFYNVALASQKKSVCINNDMLI